MKKIKVLLAVAILGFASCDDYLDVNENPSKLPFSLVTPDKLLPAAQVRTYAIQNTTMNSLGNKLMNSWTFDVTKFAGFDTDVNQLSITNTFGSGIWDNLYLEVNNLQKIIDYNDPTGEYDYYIAVAKILKAHYMQYIVDLYGDAPYSEAYTEGIITPKYDDDFAIYKALINELDEARDLINNSTNGIAITTDVMLGGDTSKWKLFANTIELRYLLRMSKATGDAAVYREDRAQILSNVSSFGFDMLNENVTINPGYSDSNDNQLNPFCASFITTTGGVVTNYALIAPTGHAYKALNPYSVYPTGMSTKIPVKENGALTSLDYPNVQDYRWFEIFRPHDDFGVPLLSANIRAVTQGGNAVDLKPDAQPAEKPGRTGLGLWFPYAQNFDNSLDPSGVDGFVMTASEAYFLQAEAGLMWPGLFYSGDQAAFEAGVLESYAMHLTRIDVQTSLPFANALGLLYLAEINAKPKFGWTGTDEEKLQAIMYQKWIALMGIHAMESFIEYNRTGYPLTPLAANAQQDRKPKRLIYPSSEYATNSANVPNISSTEVFAASDDSHPFWMR